MGFGRRCSRAVAGGALILGLAAMSPSAQATSYTLTDLGDLGGSSTYASGLNDSGEVVGYGALAGNTVFHAFKYEAGTITDISSLGASSFASAVNNSGLIVGYSGLTGPPAKNQAWSYSGGTMTAIGSTSPFIGSMATAVNDAGKVVGQSGSDAFLYSGGVTTDLGTLSGGSYSLATGISASGEIVGYGNVTGGATHAFVDNGTMTDIGTLGGPDSYALAVNASGEVVGQSTTAGYLTHAFVYDSGVMTDIGTLGGTTSIALSVNNAGDVVGYSTDSLGDYHAFLYSGGVMTDLSSILGGFSSYATGINNLGQITGYVQLSSGRSFLLTPIAAIAAPEPGAWVAMLLGVAAVGAGLRRSRSQGLAARRPGPPRLRQPGLLAG